MAWISLTHTSLKSARRFAKRVYRSLYFPPLVIFIAMLCVTYWSFRASSQNIERDRESAISDQTEALANTVKQRLSMYEEILIGAAGLFRASDDVNENEWRTYISTFDTTTRYPGVQTIGYIRFVSNQQKASLVTYMQNQGFTDFTILPAGERPVYAPTLYLEPNRPTITRGTDSLLDTTRRSAMQSAADSGKTTLTSLLQAPADNSDQNVFFMFYPQYKRGLPGSTTAERNQALEGYIYAAFEPQVFFDQVLPTAASNSDMAFEITSHSDDTANPVFATANYRNLLGAGNNVQHKQTLDFYGQTWTVNYVFNADSLSTTQRRRTPEWTIVLGILLALLLAEVIYLLLKSRAREFSLQKDRAVDLAKDELLSLASHQLRTPATTVKQYLGMVLQGFAGDVTTTQQDLLQKAYSGNERQLYIINEMLHVAKIDSGRITLAKQPCNLNKLVAELTTDMQTDVKNAGHTLKVRVPKKATVIKIDEHMLRMALENLISNAIKYTLPGGKITVALSATATTVSIAVIDSGIGIAEKDFTKLYKLFTRLNNRLTQTVGGTGVGLYLAKHLVELHNGNISVDSLPGKGSTFTIRLPRADNQKS